MGKGKNPTVSVIIPTYNRAHLVGRAIRSVLNQTYQDFEIIVVDDGSTDNTEEVVKGFNDGRIRYIRHDKNKGGAAARNTGIKVARGEYIAFLDSDDEWLARKLEKQMALFETSDSRVGVIYCRWYVVDDDAGFVKQDKDQALCRGHIWHTLLEGSCAIFTPLAIVRRECFENCGGFDESLPSYQDLDLWLRIAQYYHFDFVNEPLVVMHNRLRGKITTDVDAKLEGRRLIHRKWGPIIKEQLGERAYRLQLSKGLSQIYANAVIQDLQASQRWSAWKNFARLLATRQVSLKTFVRLLIALVGGMHTYRWLLRIWRSLMWESGLPEQYTETKV